MITQAVFGWVASFVGWLGTFIAFPAAPSAFTSLGGYMATAATYVAATDAWLPWTLAVTMCGAWAAMFVASIGVKVFRILSSYLTLGGGSAG